MEIRNYGKVEDVIEIQNLVQIQTKAYRYFLQADVPASKRKNYGIEAILREIFPVSNYDGTLSLDTSNMSLVSHGIVRKNAGNYA